ncbi:MAG: hypothetical protein M3009_06060 [Bombella apis]|uniref:hypothetical protein n=1 Tax=Bombella apis TaxID=1785988 RepID=UPI0023F18B92|nr:hypothetical protein [Bombella apis]MCT6820028.1 hypothetical protein [Bombella apis]
MFRDEMDTTRPGEAAASHEGEGVSSVGRRAFFSGVAAFVIGLLLAAPVVAEAAPLSIPATITMTMPKGSETVMVCTSKLNLSDVQVACRPTEKVVKKFLIMAGIFEVVGIVLLVLLIEGIAFFLRKLWSRRKS